MNMPREKKPLCWKPDIASLKGQSHKIFNFFVDTDGKFSAGIVDTGGKFAFKSVSPQPQSIPWRPFLKFAETFESQSAPPVSTTPTAYFSTIFASVVDTSGKFTTGVNDTGNKFASGVNDAGGKLPPVSMTPAANLPPVLLHRWQTMGLIIKLRTT